MAAGRVATVGAAGLAIQFIKKAIAANTVKKSHQPVPRPLKRTPEDLFPPGEAQGLYNLPATLAGHPSLTDCKKPWSSRELAGQRVIRGGLRVEGGEESSVYGPLAGFPKRGDLDWALKDDAQSRRMLSAQGSAHILTRLGGPGVVNEKENLEQAGA